MQLGMMAHVFKPSTRESGGSLSPRTTQRNAVPSKLKMSHAALSGPAPEEAASLAFLNALS